MFELLFHPKVVDELKTFEPRLQAKILLALEKLEKQGYQLRYPYTRPIKEGLFELRTQGKDISRTFFAFAVGQKIYILRTFVKKTQKTPQSEIDLAFSRLNELRGENQ